VNALTHSPLARRRAAAGAAFVLVVLAAGLTACSRSPNGPATNGPATGPVARAAPSSSLQFHGNEGFVIAQFSDLELSTSGTPTGADLQAIDLVGRIIDKDKPDLVVLTGDICIFPKKGKSQAWEALANVLDGKKVPWAFVNGNRDAEKCGYAKIDSIMTSRPYSLYQPGPTTIGGHGNYVLPVGKQHNGRPDLLIWCLDSGSALTGATWGITAGQVGWLETEYDLLVTKKSSPIGLAFMHVPPKQTPTEWYTTTCTGYRYASILTQGVDNGFFAACQEDSRISGCFFGHNGGNDFEGTLDGVGLCYCRYGNYASTIAGHPTFKRGARIIVVDPKSKTHGFETFIRLEDLSCADRPTHLPSDPAYSP